MKNKKISLFLCACMMLSGSAVSYAAEEKGECSLDIYDELGRAITDLSGLTEAYATVKFDGAYSDSTKAYIAVYDSDGKLLSVASEPITDDKTDFELKLSGAQAQTAKAFVWDEQTPSADASSVWSVSIKGLDNYYADMTGAFGSTETGLTYSWLSSDSKDGEYTVGKIGQTDEHKVAYYRNDTYSGKWIKFCVTTEDGREFYSEPKKLDDNWNFNRKAKVNFADVNQTTPDEYVFTVDGKDYILLDVTDSDTARYYVLSKNVAGDAVTYNPYYNADKTYSEDAAEENTGSFMNLYKYVNTDEFKANLPSAIIEHIDNNVWQITQANFWGYYGIRSNEYGGIAIPDINNLIKYCDRIGLADDGVDWWTKSLYNSTEHGEGMHYIPGSKGAAVVGSEYTISNEKNKYHIRPEFYLDKDFFSEVPVEKAGTYVRKVMRESYRKSELSGVQSEELLAEIYDAQGSVEALEISGETGYNACLTPSYTLADVEEAQLKFQWTSAKEADGEYEAILGAKENSFTLDNTELDAKYIRLEITLPSGETFVSNSVLADLFDEAAAGTLSAQEIRGILSAGNTLHFAYESSDGVTDADIVDCDWYVSEIVDGEYLLAGRGLSYATDATGTDKYYYAIATLDNGKTYQTENVLVEGYEKVKYADFINEDLTAYRENSNPEYVFTIDGQDFVLVDAIETSDTARFAVVADQTYGNLNLPGLGTLESHPDAEIVNVMENILPEAISKNIDKTIYFGESINGWGEIWDQYIGGLSAVSVKELRKYKEKIGLSVENYQSTGTKVNWVLRTAAAHQTGNGNLAYGISVTDGVFSVSLANNFRKSPDHEVRPIFYLDKDFFIENIDYNTAAPAIKKVMRDTYSYDEMITAGYTAEQLIYFVDGEELGTVSDVAVAMAEDCTMNLTYSFDGFDDVKSAITYSWLVSDAETGIFEEIPNANQSSYYPLDIDDGQYVKAVIYLPNGDSVSSNVIKADLYDEAFEGTVENQTVRGILSAGNTLHFAYETSNGVTDNDIFKCMWYVADSADGSYTLAGNGLTYATEATTTDKYYYAAATLKNGVEYKTSPVFVEGYEKVKYADFINEDLTTYRENSDASYMFTVGGQDFVLVDTIETSDTARFVVIADQTYGKLNLPGIGTLESHPDNEIVNVMDNILPEAISKNIDRTIYFGDSINGWNQNWDQYIGGLSAVSVKELRKYKEKIGLSVENYQTAGTKVSWVLRTAAANQTTNGNYAYGISVTDGVFSVSLASNFRRSPDHEVRPIFYLDKDFFTSESANISNIGANVQTMINN